MLRRSAQKAFGSSMAEAADLPSPPRETGRRQALDRLFEELHTFLADARALRVAAGSGSDAGSPPGSLTEPRAWPHGIEFVLSGPRGALRFVHTLEAWIRVEHSSGPSESNASTRAVELLALHPYAGDYRPVRKRIGGRSPFVFSSSRDLARNYLEAVGL